MLLVFKENLLKGLNMEEKKLKIEKLSDGRFKEEENFLFYSNGEPLFNCKIFYGRKPYYREWSEIFGVRNKNYFGSILEERIVNLFYEYLEPGGRIFIEYEIDEETFKELEKGIPEVLSRLGFLLFKNKFIYIKNLYFPEGFMEGGRKLKAEKPLNEQDYLEEKKLIFEKIKKFSGKINLASNRKIYKRIEEILKMNN